MHWEILETVITAHCDIEMRREQCSFVKQKVKKQRKF